MMVNQMTLSYQLQYHTCQVNTQK